MKKIRKPINEENPLTKYKRSTSKRWVDISQETGLSISTLIKIATKSQTNINIVSYGSVKTIKDTIGVHVVNDWSN